MVAASDRIAIAFQLSGNLCHDAPKDGCCWKTKDWKSCQRARKFIWLWKNDLTLQLVKDKCFKPLVPSKSNRKKPWKYNKKLYKQRNEVERLFRRLKGFRRVCTRYEKLDVMYLEFINLALILTNINYANTP